MTTDQLDVLALLRDAAKQCKQSDVTAMRRMGEGIEEAARELERDPSQIEAFVEAWTNVVGGVP